MRISPKTRFPGLHKKTRRLAAVMEGWGRKSCNVFILPLAQYALKSRKLKLTSLFSRLFGANCLTLLAWKEGRQDKQWKHIDNLARGYPYFRSTKPNQTVVIPAKPNHHYTSQTKPSLYQPNQTIIIPAKPNQIVIIPANPYQTVIIPTKPNRHNTSQTKPSLCQPN